MVSMEHSNKQPQKKTFRDQLEEDSESEESTRSSHSPRRTPKRSIQSYGRLVRRILYLRVLAVLNKVRDHWDRLALEADNIEMRPLAVAVPTKAESKKKKTKPRRDDLTGVGAVVAPTSRVYPVSRSICNHTCHDGDSLLQATGGCGKSKQNGSIEPIYWWVCQACGTRWERIAGDTSVQAPPPTGRRLKPSGLQSDQPKSVSTR